MTAPLIAPVIPPAARRLVRGRRAAGAGRRLPVTAVPVPPAGPRDMLYGFGRIDASGRIADRAVTSALGWHGGDRLTLTADAGVVTARRDPGDFGFAIAHAYAGHTDGAGDTGTATSTYVRATLTEVATALAALTGEPHPLTEPEGGQHDSAS